MALLFTKRVGDTYPGGQCRLSNFVGAASSSREHNDGRWLVRLSRDVATTAMTEIELHETELWVGRRCSVQVEVFGGDSE